MRKRIGLFGGTFDPPHKGHLSIAKAALDSLPLDEVWFIPTYEPPHKEEATSSSTHRLRMLQLMIEDEKDLRIETIELERKGKSYTIDTMNALLAREPSFSFYFIIGGDQVESLHQWYRIEELLEKVTFVGVERPGVQWDEDVPVIQLIVQPIDVSSTEVRQRIEQGERVDQWVDHRVYTYIKEHELYGYRKPS